MALDLQTDLRPAESMEAELKEINRCIETELTEADRRMLHTLDKVLRAQDVYDQPSAWGFTPCTVLPAWVRPTFSESQIEELQRIQGYLIEAPEHKVDTVLEVRDAFLQGIGVTDRHMCRAVREGGRYLPKNGRSTVN